MKKLLMVLAVVATVALPATAVLADPPAGGPPGQGECAHGNSGQTCVPDPQPTNGQDCLEHGNNGGVNEDHCFGEETTSTVTVTTATSTTTTTTTVAPTTEPTTTTPTDNPTTTTVPTTIMPTTTPVKTAEQRSTRSRTPELAFTGVEDVVPFAGLALLSLSVGSGLLWAGRRKNDT